MKILVVTDQLPGWQIGLEKAGNTLYLQSFIDWFCRRNDEITVVLFNPRLTSFRIKEKGLQYRLIGPDIRKKREHIYLVSAKSLIVTLAWQLYSHLPPLLQRLIARGRQSYRKVRGFAHVMGRLRNSREVDFFKKVSSVVEPDLVLFDGVFNFCGSIHYGQTWIVTHEIKCQRAESFRAIGLEVLPREFSCEQESRILRTCNRLIAIHWDDAKSLRRMCPDAQICVVPASIVKGTGNTEKVASVDCIFVGSSSFHNVQGLTWFLRDCWPLILNRLHGIKLYLYGAVGAQIETLPIGVIDKGVVDDLAGAYASASVVIIPLQVGSGLKVKLVEALVEGRAIVTTQIGAQGLSSFDPPPFLLADGAREFADAVCNLLENVELRRIMEERARNVAPMFSPTEAFADFDRSLSAT